MYLESTQWVARIYCPSFQWTPSKWGATLTLHVACVTFLLDKTGAGILLRISLISWYECEMRIRKPKEFYLNESVVGVLLMGWWSGERLSSSTKQFRFVDNQTPHVVKWSFLSPVISWRLNNSHCGPWNVVPPTQKCPPMRCPNHKPFVHTTVMRIPRCWPPFSGGEKRCIYQLLRSPKFNTLTTSGNVDVQCEAVLALVNQQR